MFQFGCELEKNESVLWGFAYMAENRSGGPHMSKRTRSANRKNQIQIAGSIVYAFNSKAGCIIVQKDSINYKFSEK